MGRAVQIAWKRKGGILDIKREGKGKKRALLKQVRKRAKAKGQTSKEGKAGEKNACRLVKPCFLSPLPHSSFNSLSLCLRGGQVCSDVDFCKKQEQKEREWAGVPRGQMRWKCLFSLKKTKQNLPYLVHLCTNWRWYFLSPFLLCVSVCVFTS